MAGRRIGGGHIDAQHAIAHNKVLVINGETVITGSFNFTKAAEDNNTENLLVIKDAQMAAKYAQTAFEEVASIGSFR